MAITRFAQKKRLSSKSKVLQMRKRLGITNPYSYLANQQNHTRNICLIQPSLETNCKKNNATKAIVVTKNKIFDLRKDLGIHTLQDLRDYKIKVDENLNNIDSITTDLGFPEKFNASYVSKIEDSIRSDSKFVFKVFNLYIFLHNINTKSLQKINTKN